MSDPQSLPTASTPIASPFEIINRISDAADHSPSRLVFAQQVLDELASGFPLLAAVMLEPVADRLRILAQRGWTSQSWIDNAESSRVFKQLFQIAFHQRQVVDHPTSVLPTSAAAPAGRIAVIPLVQNGAVSAFVALGLSEFNPETGEVVSPSEMREWIHVLEMICQHTAPLLARLSTPVSPGTLSTKATTPSPAVPSIASNPAAAPSVPVPASALPLTESAPVQPSRDAAATVVPTVVPPPEVKAAIPAVEKGGMPEVSQPSALNATAAGNDRTSAAPVISAPPAISTPPTISSPPVAAANAAVVPEVLPVQKLPIPAAPVSNGVAGLNPVEIPNRLQAPVQSSPGPTGPTEPNRLQNTVNPLTSASRDARPLETGNQMPSDNGEATGNRQSKVSDTSPAVAAVNRESASSERPEARGGAARSAGGGVSAPPNSIPKTAGPPPAPVPQRPLPQAGAVPMIPLIDPHTNAVMLPPMAGGPTYPGANPVGPPPAPVPRAPLPVPPVAPANVPIGQQQGNAPQRVMVPPGAQLPQGQPSQGQPPQGQRIVFGQTSPASGPSMGQPGAMVPGLGSLPVSMTMPGGAPTPGAPVGATPPVVQPDVELLRVAMTVQRSLRLRDVAATAANDGASWLQAGRVSVFLKEGRRFRPLAFSGEATVSTRSPLMRPLKTLVKLVCKTDTPFVFDGTNEDIPPGMERTLAEYVRDANPRQLVIIPLHAPDPAEKIDDDMKPGKVARKRRLFGCLVAEQTGEKHPTAEFPERAKLLANCIAPALFNAFQHETLFLLPVWRFFGDIWHGLTVRRGLLALAVVLGLVGVGTALTIVPWEYRVEAKGQLLPKHRQEVFAPLDAEVEAVLVKGGDQVDAGTPLVRLRNNELKKEITAVRHQKEEQEKTRLSLESQIEYARKHNTRQDSEAEVRLQGQRAAAQSQINSFAAQLSILEAREEQLLVRAPFQGVVATFQAEQLLLNRPVKRGEVLVSLMDDTGAWELKLQVPEDRLGHVLRAAAEVERAATETTPGMLPLDFIVVTHPESSFVGTVDPRQQIATRAVPSEKQDLVVEVVADFDKQKLRDLRIGAEVRARIHCGRKPLGYVLFGDVIEFIQRYGWWW